MKFLFAVIAVLAVPLNLLAQQADAVIFPRPTPTRLAVADFTPRAVATTETQSALTVFNKVLLDDLQFSAFFEIPSKSFYPLKPLRVPQDVAFENWQVPTLDVDYLAFGNVQVDATATVVEAYLYDVKTQEQVLGKRYTIGDSTLIRQVAHQFADQVVLQLSAGASQGVATTRIAFASEREGAKEIYVMDYDGASARRLTLSGGINKFPEWSPDNLRLAFVGLLEGSTRWQLWIQGLEGGRSTITVPSSYVSSPAFSPDGQRIAFSERTSGSLESDIFVSATDGSGMRNLTRARGIDTAPTWRPTGTQIAFISDRSGGPQLWVMDADGSNL